MDTTDVVNHPRHYQRSIDARTAYVRGALLEDVDGLNIECFEAMVSMLTIEEMRGYLRGNSLKYRWRYPDKANVQDLQKAAWYEKKLERLESALVEFGSKAKDTFADDDWPPVGISA